MSATSRAAITSSQVHEVKGVYVHTMTLHFEAEPHHVTVVYHDESQLRGDAVVIHNGASFVANDFTAMLPVFESMGAAVFSAAMGELGAKMLERKAAAAPGSPAWVNSYQEKVQKIRDERKGHYEQH